MPTAGRPRSSTLDHATRRQLDELDALMQCLLALPVNPPEDPPNPPGQQPPAETVSESTSAVLDEHPGDVAVTPSPISEPGSPVLAEQTRVENDAAKTEVGPPFLTPALAPWAPSPERMENCADTSRTSSAPQSDVFAGSGPPPKIQVKFARLAAIPEKKAPAPRVAWPLCPLLWVNLVFDQGTAWLGPFGRWLRGPDGRALLGWGGLLLLAAALAWMALDGMGWTW